jgi:hypothetical protein
MIGLLTRYARTQFLSPFPSRRKSQPETSEMNGANGEKQQEEAENDKNTTDEDEGNEAKLIYYKIFLFKIYLLGPSLSSTPGPGSQFADFFSSSTSSESKSGRRCGLFYLLIFKIYDKIFGSS